MPSANVRGVHINYEVLGTKGPWMALSPGGRRPLQGVKPLAQRMADSGYRVVIHDRRNCGASDVTIGGNDPENEIWADDLHELLGQLGALPAIIGGGSSGCRLAILFTLRYAKLVTALLLWRITGGQFAAQRLARQYYTQYIEAAESGGMAAVCATEHWQERIAARGANRDYLMKMDSKHFIEAMSRWREYFLQGAELPIIGASEADLKSIKLPACVIPGNDRTHDIKTGRNLARLLPDCELHELFDKDEDMDLVPPEEWQEKDDEIAAIFTGFLERAIAPAGSAQA
ncbi:MAG: alpha/beta hydrolase [Betaproteobacteria bacterium]|nr:alpha/beta hydrolase [Betaproteobacteria bacterium]MDH3436357.1 alpha/beta hydrolase [Betaproteobacteria bacterium]